jgi:hypothetical protein
MYLQPQDSKSPCYFDRCIRSLVSTLVFPGLRNGKIEASCNRLIGCHSILQLVLVSRVVGFKTRIRLKRANPGNGELFPAGIVEHSTALDRQQGLVHRTSSTQVLYQHSVRFAAGSCTVEAFEVQINAFSEGCREGCIEACMEEWKQKVDHRQVLEGLLQSAKSLPML